MLLKRSVLIMMALAMLLLCVGLLTASPVPANTSEEYGWLRIEQFGAPSSGTDGSATMSATSDGYVRGRIYAVYVDWSPGVTTTSDLDITGANPPITVLSKANSATDAWFYPVAAQHKNSDGSASGTYGMIPVNSRLTAAVAQSSLVTATNLVTVTVYWGQ